MKKICDVLKILEPKISLLFKMFFLITGLMFYCNITFGKPILSYFMWASISIGTIVLFCRLLAIRSFIHSKFIIIFLLFSISHIISSLVNLDYGYYENFKLLVWMVFQFAILYAYDKNRNKNDIVKEFVVLGKVYIFITAILAIISFSYLFEWRTSYFVFLENYYMLQYGMSWGRLFGAYTDPNYGAVFSVLSIIISSFCIYLLRKKVWSFLLGANIFIQVIYVALSDSRTGLVALICTAGFITVMFVIKRNSGGRFYIGKICLIAIASVVLVIIATLGIEYGYRTLNEYVIASRTKVVENIVETESVSENLVASQIASEADSVVENIVTEESQGREEDLKKDISNRRFDLWKAGIEIFTYEPLWGVGFKNIVNYVQLNIPDSYLITNDHGIFDNMHNVFFNILAGQGVIGEILVIVIIAYFFVYVIRNIFYVRNEMYYICVYLCACLGVGTCSMMFVTDIFYAITPTAFFFWLCLGYLVQILEINKGAKK